MKIATMKKYIERGIFTYEEATTARVNLTRFKREYKGLKALYKPGNANGTEIKEA